MKAYIYIYILLRFSVGRLPENVGQNKFTLFLGKNCETIKGKRFLEIYSFENFRRTEKNTTDMLR